MNRKALILLAFVLGFARLSFCQSSDPYTQIKALNNYVNFTNESIHGMMIVHRLLENFNQEVNKYVDLQSNMLNFYANKDLPANVFVDEERLFYRTSPYEFYAAAKAESTSLKTTDRDRLNASLEAMKGIIDDVNQVRFDLKKFIADEDLTEEGNQTKIYGMLEGCVDLYEEFYRKKEILRQNLNEIYLTTFPKEAENPSPEMMLFSEIHNRALPAMKALRYEELKEVSNYAFRIKTKIKQLQNTDHFNPFFKRAKIAAIEFASDLQQFVDQDDFPQKYALYGKHYYYHNVELASAFNSYGKRFVKYANKFFQNTNPMSLLLIEEPHFYKVIYPKKEIKKPVKEEVITQLPTEVKKRDLVVRQQSIPVDSKRLELEIYDHKEQDGDIVSINFNGNWILEKQTITNRPLKLMIDLNTRGENYIIMHAENLGSVPPNTAAVRYYYKGERKSVILNSNMNESEMIKLELQ